MESQLLKRLQQDKICCCWFTTWYFNGGIDNTIVATAMATIVGDLGGFDKFVWVTSAYMVATMAGMPIFGKTF